MSSQHTSTAISPSAVHGEPSSLTRRLALFAADIRISHTIFAMPWAILATFLAADGMPRAGQLALIVACMVLARTVAMAANRLLDARLDALNPRTAKRAIPSGALSARFIIFILIGCGIGFLGAAWGFWFLYGNFYPIALALPVLGFLAAYPLMKRFTRWCHYYLGAALALAPVCAWLAVRGSLDWTPIIMAGAVLLWTAGFDIIYACQDYGSDRQTGVFSVPATIGIGPALWAARGTHVLCVAMLSLLGLHSYQLSDLYFIGVVCAGLLLIIEHSIVRPHDLSRVGLAFFTINGIISVLMGTLGTIDVFVR